jgi:GNAT superfamily N-acetyltransferase
LFDSVPLPDRRADLGGPRTISIVEALSVRPRRVVEDARGVARLMLESSVYYATLAPDCFAPVDDDGLVDWLSEDGDWLADPANTALVADLHGEVIGYLEASIQRPTAVARFSGNRDAREPRLFINAVVTAERHKRRGVATALVEAAEAWARDHGVRLAL